MEEREPIMLFKKVLKQLIKDLEAIQDVQITQFEEEVIDAFDGYNYEGEDEVIGFDSWCDISNDGNYELNSKVDHEDAYELTLFITTKDGKVTVNNVL